MTSMSSRKFTGFWSFQTEPSYLTWLLARECGRLFSDSDAEAVLFAVTDDFAGREWFSLDSFNTLEPAVHKRLDMARPGPETGVLLPLVHAIEGANSAGCNVAHSTGVSFGIYTIVVWKFLREQIPKVGGVMELLARRNAG